MTSTSPEYGPPNGQPWQQGAPVPPQQPPYQPPPYQPAQQPSAAAAPAAGGYVLHRWPRWAQNTAVIVGAVAVLVIVFFAGFFTANAVDHGHAGVGTGQNFQPRQFGNGGGNGNGFGRNGGQDQNGGTGGQSQSNG